MRDSRDAITTIDLHGKILAWNPSAVRMYGWSEAEALTLNITDITPASQHELAIPSEHDTLQPLHTQRVTKQGKLVEVIIIRSALLNDSGAVYAISTTERLCNETDEA